MKQISQNYKSGDIRLENVNAPALKPGGVLVQTSYSVISAGTEGMKVKEGKMSYLGKARARPDQVKKVMQSVQQQGLVSTYQKVMNKLDSLTPLGYSSSGIVMAVGPGAEKYRVGQRVACAGAGYANHAEVNFVPANLVVPVPDNVDMKHAAFATVGAIAMQGFRQAEGQLGETCCVIGLGLLGQLLVQLLRAAGMHVIGVDLVESRCRLAEEIGAVAAVKPDDPGLTTLVHRTTGGFGVDCVFITAGGDSNGPAELAVEVARDRGRVVDVGKTRLDLSWNDYYMKELDVRFSRSYGPGRYDPNYEEKGIDYPIGYVRWTERRNMAAFLDLISGGRVSLDRIIDSVRPFDEAEQVYLEMAEGKSSGLGVVFEHSGGEAQVAPLPRYQPPATDQRSMQSGTADAVRLGIIGAGNYASSMLLPHLQQNKDVLFTEVATATSLSAENAARKFGFQRTSTDYKGLLGAGDIDAVIIATQHSSHSRMVAEALTSGKAVYVEKPLAIDRSGLESVSNAIQDSGNSRLMVGFNRRFSPLVREMRKAIGNRDVPLVMHYRVHAGQIEAGSWYLDSQSQGSRFIGEAGHFFDVFSFLSGARPVSVYAKPLRPGNITDDDLENIAVIVEYDDGSIGNLLYLTQGSMKVPKEYLEVFGGGKTVQLHNFEYLSTFAEASRKKIKGKGLDKGQKEEMASFVRSVKSGGSMPIDLDSLIDTTWLTLAAEESFRREEPIRLADYRVSRSE